MIKKFVVVFLLFLFAFTACKEEISDAGGILIPPADKFNIAVFNSDSLSLTQSVVNYSQKIDLGSSTRILLGKFENIKSTALLKFFLFIPDSLINPLTNDSLTVIDSWVELPINYTIGDTNSALTFEAHNITNFWLAADFDLDSLNALGYDAANIAAPRENSDSLISFGISKELVYNWMKKRVDDTYPSNYGMVIIPDNSNSKMIGFQGLANLAKFAEPALRVVVETPEGTRDTISGSSSGDVHVLEGASDVSISNRIYLQSNVTLRGKYIFDHNVFPKDAIINKAQLTFFIDTVNTRFGNIISDSIMVNALSDSVTKEVNTRFRTHYLGKTGNSYSGDITSSLQNWINGKDNQGFILRLSDELRSINKLVLYGPGSAVKKPRLLVYYTDKN